MYSGSLEVGNSYPWSTPPSSVYVESFSAASHFDGADITYNQVSNGALITWQFTAGSSESNLFDIPVKVDQVRGATISVELESLFLRYGYASYALSYDVPALDIARGILSGLTATSPVLGEVIEDIDDQNVPAKLHEIGIRWEHDAYTVDAEFLYAMPPGEKIDADVKGAYLSVARQLGLHCVYGVIGASNTKLRNGLAKHLADSKNDIPEGANPLLDIVRQTLATGFENYSLNTRKLTLGYRYDITESWDIKSEVQSVWFDEIFAYDAYTTPPDATEKGQLYIVHLVTDWVF